MKQAFLCGVLGLLAMPAWSQVAKPTADEAKISVYDVPGGSAFRSDGLSEEPGLPDPRDFTGTWDNQAGGTLERFLKFRAAQARGEGGAPPADSGTGAQAPQAATPSAPPGGARADQTYKNACMPTVGVVSGGDGPVEIIQTNEQLTWMAEEMHAIRRIFLKGSFTANFKPNYLGESIGHFEDDTLVVETRGMKSLGAGVRMMERIGKSDEGRVLHNQVSYIDADGKPTGNSREITLYYRPQSKMMEWICEDNGQIYQTGVNGKPL